MYSAEYEDVLCSLTRAVARRQGGHVLISAFRVMLTRRISPTTITFDLSSNLPA